MQKYCNAYKIRPKHCGGFQLLPAIKSESIRNRVFVINSIHKF